MALDPVRPLVYPNRTMESPGFGHAHPSSPGGAPYSREVIDEVWLLAEPIEGNDDALWRRDEFGSRMQRHDYGKHGSQFGWAISDAGAGRLKPVHWCNLGAGSSGSSRGETNGLFADMPELF